jgi:hypothetical protein
MSQKLVADTKRIEISKTVDDDSGEIKHHVDGQNQTARRS